MENFSLVSVFALAMSFLALLAVVLGLLKMRADTADSRHMYRTAFHQVQDTGEMLADAGTAMKSAREDLRVAQCRAEEHAEELQDATERIQAATSEMGDLADELEKQNDILAAQSAEEGDTVPTGSEGLTPVAHVTWREDGDDHYAQVTLWPTGGGIDLSLAVNGSGESLSLDWKSFDVLATMAARVRSLDNAAPEPLVLVTPDFALPFADEVDCDCPGGGADCPNCGQTEAERRAAWAEIAGREDAGPPAKTEARCDKWCDVDSVDD